MAKNGRTMADRKKIESVSATKTIQPSECGKIFILQSGSVHPGTYQLTMPAASEAGEGWWAKFIVGATDGGDVTITGSSSDKTAYYVNRVVGADVGVDQLSGVGAVAFDVSECVVGDTLEVVSSGTAWYCQAVTSGSAAFGEGS